MLNRSKEDEPRLPAGVRPSRATDLDDVLHLLAEAGLPQQGVSESFDDFVVAERDGSVVAAGGIEQAGNDCLLRSVVVARSEQGRGTGRLVVARLIAEARARRIDSLWLLTETAADYFADFGFERRDRAAAPGALRATAEFQHCCPSSAIAMARRATPYRILVVCTANRARSQIAEALIQHHFGDQVVVASAGTTPGTGPHQLAIAVLAEQGIEWQERTSKSIESVGREWDLVITVCADARDACPVVPGVRSIHWGMTDPVGRQIEAFRSVVTVVQARIRELVP